MKDLKRYARQQKALLTADPDGLLATLQIARRLINESMKAGEPITVIDAVEQAITMASPKDEARVWWQATRILFRHTEAEKSVLAILADAIEAQGKMNHQIKKRIAA